MRAALAVELLKMRRSRVVAVASALMVVLMPFLAAGFMAAYIAGGDSQLAAKVSTMINWSAWWDYLGLMAQLLSVGAFLLLAGYWHDRWAAAGARTWRRVVLRNGWFLLGVATLLGVAVVVPPWPLVAAAVGIGVVGGLLVMPFDGGVQSGHAAISALASDAGAASVALALGCTIALTNVIVQFGLARVPANQAALIMLFEIVVAAISSWWLASEGLGAREIAGGLCIVAAGVLSGILPDPGRCKSATAGDAMV